ncbi:MAG: thiol peroxidase [Chloroflexota bacterium]
MSERIVTLKGDMKFTLGGTPVSAGDKATDVALDKGFGNTFNLLADTAGKVRLVSVVPSIDTGICAAQTKRMSEEASSAGDNTAFITVSADLPPAQGRWASENGVDNVTLASDHMSMAFGEAYGTTINELRMEQRAIFVIDADDNVSYAEYVPEIAQHPDYDAALAALKEAA